MSETAEKSPGLTRRSFLKSTAAAAGTAMLGSSFGCSLGGVTTSGNAGEKVFNVVCVPNCAFGNCSFDARVRDGKLVHLEAKKDIPVFEPHPPATYDRRGCLRGRTNIQWIYHSERIKYPLKRSGERGEGKWEKIGWDEAIATIAERFNSYGREFGYQSIIVANMTGNQALLQSFGGVVTRFAYTIGASYYDFSCDWGIAMGQQRVTGGPFCGGNAYWDAQNAKTIILWGFDPADTQIQVWHHYREAQESGAKLIVIDPRFSTTASKADVFVPIRPGTDIPLAMTMLNLIISEDLINHDYVIKYTNAPFLIKENGKVLRESDLGIESTKRLDPLIGQEIPIDAPIVWDQDANAYATIYDCANPELHGAYSVEGIQVITAFQLLEDQVSEFTLEKGSEMTGLDPEQIEGITTIYATQGPSTLVTGFGPDRYGNADTFGHATSTIGALTGNIGIVGGGTGEQYTASPWIGLSTSEYVSPNGQVSPQMPFVIIPDIVRTGKLKGESFPVKAIFNMGSNVFSNLSDQNELLKEILPQIDFIVTHESRMTDTCMYSDIILPACHWFEAVNLVASPYMQLSEQAIEPLYESKSNFQTISMIADAMGFGEYFNNTEEEVLQKFFKDSPAEQAGITLERLKQEKVIHNIGIPDGVMFSDKVFYTPSRRLEIYQESPTPRMDFGQVYDERDYYLPKYQPPREVYADNPLREKYPLTCMQPHSKYFVHTHFGGLPWLKELNSEPSVYVSREDALERGIENGDIVKIFNDRGSVTLKAFISDGLPLGACSMVRGWSRDAYISGHHNELSLRYVEPLTASQIYADCLVDIQKV
ncbi:MAG: molybdopterin-dependent oxidoreductase [Coriobacteriales bacterium]|nr:molybdopterin-dependent oxidoreductase [Coriobacteriales bacterium]